MKIAKLYSPGFVRINFFANFGSLRLKCLIFSSTISAILFLSACQTANLTEFPEITFRHTEPIKLNVRNLKIIDFFKPTYSPPHVEHEFPIPPAQVLKTWANDRIKPVGTLGTVLFLIKDASVVEEKLRIDESISGLFLTEQSHRYRANITVQVKIVDIPNTSDSIANATANRSQTINEGISINNKQQFWFEMTEFLVKEFNVAMEDSIRKHLSNFLSDH
tara:strand:- start:298 stop:957 length:660 start_codon:yes stop_codon:yes gene_type:complete